MRIILHKMGARRGSDGDREGQEANETDPNKSGFEIWPSHRAGMVEASTSWRNMPKASNKGLMSASGAAHRLLA